MKTMLPIISSRAAQGRAMFAVVTAVALAACSRFDSSHKADTGESSAANPKSAVASNPGDTALTVTATGYGALRIGMTVNTAATVLGPLEPSAVTADTSCSYVHFRNAPPGMKIMVTGGTVARIEVDSSSIPTGLGIRVGDPEARVKAEYGPRMSIEPHKYVANAHYLVVSPIPPTDSNFRLVFETDGSRVTSYRAGRLPEVQWVEGCA